MLVEIRSLAKSYVRAGQVVPVLSDITLDIEAGDFIALMGPSGSGKTTLLNLIAGIDKPDSGTLRVGGVDIAALSEAELADWRAANVGFVFQFYNLMPVLSALENVELPLLVAGITPKEARRKALDALELVGVAERAGHVPDKLSGGERQRVTIARALVNDPAIVWADEPTGDLDSENAQEIVALMRTLNRERGLSFLIVTHDISVGRSTDRIIRMLDGRVVEEQRLEEAHVRAGHPA